MDPLDLTKSLRDLGLVILAVSQHPEAEHILTVYLHGNQGQWIEGEALCLVTQIPEVIKVTESALTPTILIVKTRS